MKALVFKNSVVQVCENEFPVAKELQWMNAPEGCEPGWYLEGNTLHAPVIPPNSNN